MSGAIQSISDFRDLARGYSRAETVYQNAIARGNTDTADNALDLKRGIEEEFLRCFNQVKKPDLEALISCPKYGKAAA